MSVALLATMSILRTSVVKTLIIIKTKPRNQRTLGQRQQCSVHRAISRFQCCLLLSYNEDVQKKLQLSFW